MAYEIRNATEKDILLMLTWAKEEGWNPGINDHTSFQAADKNGFFIGYLDNMPATSLSAVRYSSKFGFIGLYIVKPEFRGQGLGIKIWNHGIDYLKETDIVGLDGVIQQQTNYKKSGFHLAHRNIRYSGIVPGKQSADNLVDLKNISLESILRFEEKLFPCARPDFLKSWISHAAQALAYVENDKIAGYGVIRKCDSGYKIGPLFAKSEDIAEQLFLGLCSHVPGQLIILDIPEPNQHALELAQRYQLKPIFETARMYTNRDPGLDLQHIFGITTFELG